MREDVEITIKIGKTKIVELKNSPRKVSVTEFWINGGEKKEARISPHIYATPKEIMNQILDYCADILESI